MATTGGPSPTLAGLAPRPVRALELKFLLDEAAATRVEAWARASLRPDPCGAARGAWRSTTLYLDTPSLGVARREEGLRRDRWRVRAHAEEPNAALEHKRRKGDRVRTTSCAILRAEVVRLGEAAVPPDWPGAWFHALAREHGLAPAARVTFLRTGFVGDGPDGPVRLVLDREVLGAPEGGWRLDPVLAGADLLDGAVLVEMGFPGALPAPFRRLVADLGLRPRGASKYRACLRAAGLLPPEGTPRA